MKKCCGNCVFRQGVFDEKFNISEKDCINRESPYYRDGVYKDDTCGCWQENNRVNLNNLKRKQRRKQRRQK